MRRPLFFALALTAPAAPCAAQLVVQSLAAGATPNSLVSSIVGGGGLSVSNVVYTGAPSAAGLFSGGSNALGFGSGVILSTGNVNSAPGPNNSDSRSGTSATPGDDDLDALIPGFPTRDAAVLEFDFECATIENITLRFVFASEEYNEYVFAEFNDRFGFFLNGLNVAFLPDGVTPVSIDSVNGGNPFGSANAVNSEYFRNNDLTDGGGSIPIQYDGLTVVLSVSTPVLPGTNHLKLAIADASDTFFDSAVFLESSTFTCGFDNQPPSCSVDLEPARLEFFEPQPGAFVVTEGETFAATFTGLDPDGDELAVALAGLPGATLSTEPVEGGLAATLLWTPTFADKAGAPYTASVTFTDPDGQSSTCSILFADVNLRPDCSTTVGAGSTLTFECTSTAGATVTLAGSATDADDGPAALMYHWDVSDLDVVLDDDDIASPTGVFPEGNTMATLTVTDGRGGVAICDVMIEVVDTTPPELACSSDRASLWPPNHSMQAVTFYVFATDACEEPGGVSLTLRAASDEPDDANGNGDGSTTGDLDGSDAFSAPVNVSAAFHFDPSLGANGGWVGTLDLRAERAGTGDGRKYILSVDASDSDGNLASASCCVIVPHDRRGGAN